MKISLKSALTTPFNRKFALVAGLLGIVLLCAEILSPASIFKEIIPTLPFSSTGVLILTFLLSIGIQFFATGYVLKFAHNRVHGKNPLFENLSVKHIFWGAKSFVFTVILAILSVLMMIPVALIMSLIHPTIGVILFVSAIVLLVLFYLVCWTKFIDTLRISEPFRFPSTYYLLSNAWWSYFKIIGNLFLAVLIMIIPIVAINMLTAMAMIFAPLSVYIGIFAIAFTTLYPSFVFAHITAQGYAGIKNDLKAKWIAQAKAEKRQAITPAPAAVEETTKTTVSENSAVTPAQPAKPKKIATKRKIILPEGAPKTATVRKTRKPAQKKNTTAKKK